MQRQNKQLFKKLVEAYYENRFEETLKQVLLEDFNSKSEAKNTLAILCGVDVEIYEDDYQFIYALLDAITQQQVRQKIIQKVGACEGRCHSPEEEGKCQSVCPLDAIVKTSLGNDKWIDIGKCIQCGRCAMICEAENYWVTSEFIPLAQLMRQKNDVVAIVAPAIAGQFGEDVSLDQLREAIIQVGFKDMIEVALAADILSIKEAVEFSEQIENEGDFMITSCCCPMWVATLRKVYHQLVGAIDYVLTFEEMQIIFEALKIVPSTLPGMPSVDYASRGGRLYARTGGVSQAVWDIVDQLFPEKRNLYNATQVDGMKDCKEMLEEITNGKVRASFIEGMGCAGGCVGGSKTLLDY